MSRSQNQSGQVLLLRGCPSPEWIKAIGGKYRIDPEFIQRHLDFFATLAPRSVFSLPSLASSTSNIIRLTTSTVVYQDTSLGKKKAADLQASRRTQAEDMSTYRRQYQNNCHCGDSIVREISMLDENYSILEQSISIRVQRNHDGWIGMCACVF